MSELIPFKVKLSNGQKQKIQLAVKKNCGVKIRLGKTALSGEDDMLLTQRQINRIQKAREKGVGVMLEISKSNILKVGGSLLGSAMKLLPFATKAVSKIIPPLATGAMSALGSLGIDSIFGKGSGATGGGVTIPPSFLSKLASVRDLTKGQINQVRKGLMSGRGFVLKPTKRQMEGGLLGTLAAIGIPMAIQLASKLFGGGLHPPAKKAAGMMVPVIPGRMPYEPPPPFYGQWPTQGQMGSGRKKKIRGRSIHGASSGSALKPRWKDVPLTNFDLEEWVEWLKIPHFEGIFSRDDVSHVHEAGCCIINLDDGVGNGTHWVATKVEEDDVLYFDSFCMPPPEEFVEYTKRLGKTWIFNGGHPIQEMDSVRCGWYCLFFLDRIWKESFYDVLSVFDLVDQKKNEAFIKKFFQSK